VTAYGDASPDEFARGLISVDGLIDERRGIVYIGDARRQPDGSWICLANVQDNLCLVEIDVVTE
jgi:hypothetical protein